MKKFLLSLSILLAPGCIFAQSVTGAYTISQNDLRGTARYMSMGGAFGALGGDLSAITQNPGGIGIYRSNEIGITGALDMNSTTSQSLGISTEDQMTRFNLNNIGAVFTMNLNNYSVPNINFGFVYNKTASFNRRFKGTIPYLQTSLSNYIAGMCNTYGLTESDVQYGDTYDPYQNGSIPWIAPLGYNSYLVTPEMHSGNTNWYGQFGNGTSGTGGFQVNEKGSVDNYNIILGGNINNVFYIGMNFDITSVDYRIQSAWGEALDNAYVYNEKSGAINRATQADWALYDNYRLNGTGFKFNMGFIVKPIQEFRLGFAFHTPTFYNLNETFYDTHIDYDYRFSNNDQYGSAWTNDGYPASNSINFMTPWRLIASAAGVIGSNFIISAEYEWDSYKSMKYSDADIYDYYDPWYDWDDPWNDWGWGSPWFSKTKAGNSLTENIRSSYTSPNDYANAKIKEVYRNTSTFRVGAEYRIIPQFSIRAGYSYSASPITNEIKNYRTDVPGIGVMTNYTLDNSTSYITAGLGFKSGGFYADLAYVYKNQTSEYYPYSPDLSEVSTAVKSKLTTNNSNVVLSLGYKF